MKAKESAMRIGRRFVGKGLAWAQVNHPERVARGIQFAIARKSSSKHPEESSTDKVAGINAAMQAAGASEALDFQRNNGIKAAGLIASITPELAATIDSDQH